MKVEVLYVAHCPSHSAAVSLVRDVLAAEGLSAEISEVLISDNQMAKALSFQGSPTIRVNGRDVAEESPLSADCAVSCRLYLGSSDIGLPPVEWIRRAVSDARKAST